MILDKERVIHVLRITLLDLLGESGVRVLEFHMSKRTERSIYDIFYEEPHHFYQIFRDFFGSGADAIIRLIAEKLIERGYVQMKDPDELLEALRRNDEYSRQILRNSFIIREGEDDEKSSENRD